MLKNLYDLDAIKTDNYRDLNPKIVDDLTQSIMEVGLQEPIQLYHIEETGELYVISGHHRLAAMKRVKKHPMHQGMVFQAHVTRRQPS